MSRIYWLDIGYGSNTVLRGVDASFPDRQLTALIGPKAPADDSAHESPIRGRLMSPAELHADSIVIDGLIIAKWNRELFEDMRKGGLTAANCTVSVWEGFQATINNIVASQTLIRENSDVVIPVKTTADIRRAKEQGKTGIIFGFQIGRASCRERV